MGPLDGSSVVPTMTWWFALNRPPMMLRMIMAKMETMTLEFRSVGLRGGEGDAEQGMGEGGLTDQLHAFSADTTGFILKSIYLRSFASCLLILLSS